MPELPQYFKKRLELLAAKSLLSKAQCNEFEELEAYMEEGKRPEGLGSFHKTNDKYLPLLEKVLKAMAAINEPHAEAKFRVFIEEKAIMAPGVFLTPWEMTLGYLDRQIGNIGDVVDFYR